MASMQEITCKCGCGRKKMVRTADVNRGWGLFYSKSCKAKEQERRTGQHAAHKNKLHQYQQDWLINNCNSLYERHPDSFDFDDMDGHFSNENGTQNQ